MKKQKCCLCDQEFEGMGNNAQPLKDGRCCDSCNKKKVVPARRKNNNLTKEFEVRLKKETINKIERKISGTDITVEDYVNKVVRRESERIANIDMSNIEEVYKLFGIQDNDRLKNYQLVIQRFINSYHSGKDSLDNKEFGEISEEMAKKFTLRYQYYIKPMIEDAKVFELDDEIIPVLKLNDVGKQNFPFNNIIIETRVQILDRIYFALLIGSYYTEDNIKYKAINSIYAQKQKDGTYSLNDDFVFMDEDIEKKFITDESIFTSDKQYKKQSKELRKFINAFLNYVNSPDVIIKEIPYNPKNNLRRIEKKRFPLPQTNRIYIQNVHFKRFVDEINEGVRKFGFSYKFWVRGHYEHFRNQLRYRFLYRLDNDELQKRGYKRDNDGTIMKWKNPYVKGEGLLKDKTYYVK